MKRQTNSIVAIAFLLVCAMLTAAEPAGYADFSAAESVDTLDGLRGRVRIGAEIFLDPGHTREDIGRHFRG